ncbi:hypothetical protein SLA2020_281100 [Shorea laevis]
MLTRLGGLLGDGSVWHDGLAAVAHVLWECMAFAVVAQVLPELMTLLVCWLWAGACSALVRLAGMLIAVGCC